MKYVSTRNANLKIDSAEAIIRGLSADGGLFMPNDIAVLSQDEINSLVDMDYKSRAMLVLSKFLVDYSKKELEDCINGAYTEAKFGSHPAPVKKLDDNNYVLELWHGPTCAFKDMALQLMPRLLTTAIKKSGSDKTTVILVATSGNTGKAALEGFCDVDKTKILVFYPAHGVSEVQRKQMNSQAGDNTGVIGLEGNFDDCQSGVKMIFSDDTVAKNLDANKMAFSSANSINWGRLVPQIVYYFSAYADMVKTGDIKMGDKVDFVVPTGNFGDILAGFIAKKMGLFVNRLICASNTNKVLTDFIQTGVYDKNRDFFTTISPSMDILISSNLERLLFILSNFDSDKVAGYMADLNTKGKYEIDADLLSLVKAEFDGGFADEDATIKAIGKAYEKYNYVMDPHTAVAYSVSEEIEADCPRVILSTASPYKFPASVISGLGGDAKTDNEFELFERLNKMTGVEIPASLANLEKAPVRFKDVCEKDEMTKAVYQFLGI